MSRQLAPPVKPIPGFMLNAARPAAPGQCQEIVPAGVRCGWRAAPGDTRCPGHQST